MSAPKKVIFVTGSGYSGVTLLGMMLAVQENGLFVGDMELCTRKSVHTCQACGTQCSLWSNFTYQRNISAHVQVMEQSGATTIVDTTKQPVSWIAEQVTLLTQQEIPWSVVLAMADPRAVIYQHFENEPDIPIEEHIEKWRVQTGAREKLFRNVREQGSIVRVQYEDMALKPEETVRAVCEAVGLPFNENMLYPGRSKQHRLVKKAGSKEFVDSTKRIHITLDNSWEQALPQQTLDKIVSIAEDLFPLYLKKHE